MCALSVVRLRVCFGALSDRRSAAWSGECVACFGAAGAATAAGSVAAATGGECATAAAGAIAAAAATTDTAAESLEPLAAETIAAAATAAAGQRVVRSRRVLGRSPRAATAAAAAAAAATATAAAAAATATAAAAGAQLACRDQVPAEPARRALYAHQQDRRIDDEECA